jgi:hypothetical protein
MRIAIACLLLAACNTGSPPASEPVAHEAPAPEAAGDGRTFGAPLEGEREVTSLATILGQPEQYRGQVVRTEGEIARVCQRMGCWMELRENADGPAVRVPMAGHSFFLPRDVAGRRATLEGRVQIAELSADHRQHLESEGATATASALSIEATSVVVR